MPELGPVPKGAPARPMAPPPPPARKSAPPPPRNAAGGAGAELQRFKLRKTSGPARADKMATLREEIAAEKAANERLRAVDMVARG